MPAAIPEMIKSRVIAQWLRGISRDAIARDNNISAGAVSNIIRGWTNALGNHDADVLRELGKSLKIAGLSPVQCATGFRTMNILADRGIDGETAEHFISDTYKNCEKRGITPTRIVSHIEDMIKFSDQVRLPEIEDYINRKTTEKEELDKRLEDLRAQISNIEVQKSELERSRDLAFEQKRKATEEMKSYFNAEQELDKHKISITGDVQKFACTVKCIAEYGYKPKKVLAEFGDIRNLANKRQSLEIATDGMEKNLARLRQEDHSLRLEISLHSENLSVYNELANIGFGPRQLRSLLHTIVNIMNSNGINHWLAIGKFFKDIEIGYDTKLGFESEKESLNLEIQILKEEREKELQGLKTLHFVGPMLMRLFQTGLTESDILKFAETYLSILNRTYSAEKLSMGIINVIDMMTAPATSSIKKPSNNNLTVILRKVREDLSRLDFAN